MFDTPALPRLSELLQEVRDGTIQIPEFQRGYVWSDDDRLLLMDSIWQGIPIGSLLVWRTKPDKGIQVTTKIGPCQLPEAAAGTIRNYLVDGLQRVTTLYTALMTLPDGLERDAEERRWPIYFDLETKPGKDLRFCLRHGHQMIPPTWMPLSVLLDDDLFFEFRTQLTKTGHNNLLAEARRLESRFRDYVIPVMPLVSDDQELVTQAFTRVNSHGQDLDEGDMVHARTLGDAFSFNKELATVVDQLSSVGWDGIERKTLIAALKAVWDLDLYKTGAKGIQEKLRSKEDRALLRTLPDLFEPVAEVLQTFGVYGPGSLPYVYQLVALIRAAHRVGGDTLKDAAGLLRQWFFWSTYNEHFTGMNSGQLRAEFNQIEELIRGTRQLDWIKKPYVAPLHKLRPNAVRSRAAILVMARAGDREVGGDKQQRLYGAQGTSSLHRLFTDQSAEDLANRVLATDKELKDVRAWALELSTTTPGLFQSISSDLLRQNLLAPCPAGADRTWSLLQVRAERLQSEERAFVEELGAVWEAP